MKKKLLIILTTILCLSSCDVGEDYAVDPSLMPAVTLTGENTFGCLIDGWVYTSGRYSKPRAVYIPATKEDEDSQMEIHVEVGEGTYIHLLILNPKERELVRAVADEMTAQVSLTNHDHVLQQETVSLVINRFSQVDSHIISGTFQGEIFQEGRFDLQYAGEEE